MHVLIIVGRRRSSAGCCFSSGGGNRPCPRGGLRWGRPSCSGKSVVMPSQRAESSAHVVRAVRIDLHQSLSGIDHAPLLGPYPAAQREIKGDATVLVQQLIRALQRVLGSFYTLSGLGHFEAINFKHFPASFAVAVPSIVVNRRRSRLFRPRRWLFPAYKRVGGLPRENVAHVRHLPLAIARCANAAVV
ncbi:hypothetical protein BQ8482_280014 [Mesorhizobium delmotii]|uniref:Uncharacterized protein n=1 Tax=Mesorhizobium delmotii TaxID=1631247 RepID=A0A2P9AMC1_9HYPH|nr:hypothetical protein BQ8482_280014 [Mesorhizobium delmotii]